MSQTSKILPLNSILVEGRLREDLGDIEELAASIRDNGLMQPPVVEAVVVDGVTQYQLRAGGRRYAALTLLATNEVPCDNPYIYENIPVTLFSEMPSHQRVKMELEENLRRKDMTWIEKVVGIVKYHKAARRAALLDGEQWSQAMTGDLLNMSQASVSVAFTIYEEIVKKNPKVLAADNLNDALKSLVSDQLDAAQHEQMRRIQLKKAEAATLKGAAPVEPVSSKVILSAEQASPATVADRVQFSKEEISAFYSIGDCLQVMPRLAAAGPINHIICDPPYGIEMSNLAGADASRAKTIARIADTHVVEENLALLPEFLRTAYEVIALDGFLCMWYDLDHHEKIRIWAEKIGWRVQRWPLVWCKTSSCSNNAAQYNVTKATEVCYFMRRSEQSVLKKKQATNYLLAGSASTPTHPFCKPAAAWNYCIESVSSKGQTILDPFAGEGSSLAAIFNSGRIPLGIEIDEKHVASGLSFIQSQLNKKSILDDILHEPPL